VLQWFFKIFFYLKIYIYFLFVKILVKGSGSVCECYSGFSKYFFV
jgi:hypothetical protein